MLLEVQTPEGPFPTIGVPWNFSVTPAAVRLAPPLLNSNSHKPIWGLR
jgi:hypothetical protein